YVKEGKGEKSSWLKEQKEGKGAAECDNERPDPVYHLLPAIEIIPMQFRSWPSKVAWAGCATTRLC
ncbi:MAG: hypothetical protein KUL75_07335, partial [Sterolibacterium sp.]|nr:hypothetical protein [Sterolibacterium sp.]